MPIAREFGNVLIYDTKCRDAQVKACLHFAHLFVFALVFLVLQQLHMYRFFFLYFVRVIVAFFAGAQNTAADVYFSILNHESGRDDKHV